MEFKIEGRSKEFTPKFSKEDFDIVLEFSKEVKKELKELIRAIILFGSTVKKYKNDEIISTNSISKNDLSINDNKNVHKKSSISEKSNVSDIDILLILDDVSIKFTPELVEAYRIIVEKIVLKVSKRIHVTSLKFTNFWEYVRAGDPVAINILRDGVAILDTGFFNPLQLLLYQGRIRPSAESIHNYMTLSSQTLFNSKRHILAATLDLYWAVIDAAHAVLMSINEIPPSPSHVADLIDDKLVKTKLIDKRYSSIMRRFYELSKSITRGEIVEISGDQYDLYYKEANDFVQCMKQFLDRK